MIDANGNIVPTAEYVQEAAKFCPRCGQEFDLLRTLDSVVRVMCHEHPDVKFEVRMDEQGRPLMTFDFGYSELRSLSPWFIPARSGERDWFS